MVTPSLPEQITESFYAWELRGRGWQMADYAVALEPPFRRCRVLPQFARHALLPLDDGKRPTLLSSFVDRAALHGTWLGVWVQGGYGEMFLRVVEVTTKDGVCSARLSYSPSKTPVPAREVVAVKGGMLSFPCSRSRSGTCSLKRTGDDLWASYSDPSGGTNSAVFRKVAPQAK